MCLLGWIATRNPRGIAFLRAHNARATMPLTHSLTKWINIIRNQTPFPYIRGRCCEGCMHLAPRFRFSLAPQVRLTEVVTSSTRLRIECGKAGQGLDWNRRLSAVSVSIMALCPHVLRGVGCEGTSQHAACQKYPALVIRLKVSIYIHSCPHFFVVCNNCPASSFCRFISRPSSFKLSYR